MKSNSFTEQASQPRIASIKGDGRGCSNRRGVIDKPITLHFDQFGIVTLIGSVLLVSFIVLKGKTNYLEEAILCACFAAISYVLNTLF